MITLHRNDLIQATCRQCNVSVELAVNINDFAEWHKGKYIQEAMPYLSADEREILISGICGDCFDKMFGEKE